MSSDIISTVDQLDACGSYAWPGGYPIVFYPVDEYGSSHGDVLCFACARDTLAEPVEDDAGVIAEIESGDQQCYGGVTCDQCYQFIVEAVCPECLDAFDDKPRLYATSVDAHTICQSCAAKLVCGHVFSGGARRLPGIGIEITHGGGVHSPWYAPAGTIYRYH